MATPDRFSLPQLAESTRKPEWLKVRMPHGQEYERVRAIVRQTGLATVCEEARCPNIAECWGGGTATGMLMGGGRAGVVVEGGVLHPRLPVLPREGGCAATARPRGAGESGPGGEGARARI